MYRTIEDKFWTDPKIKGLKWQERYLLLYLITSPHAHYCGLYYCPVSFILEESGLNKKQVEAGLKQLQEAKIIMYDITHNVIWIINMNGYQNAQGGNPAQIKRGIESQIKSLHSVHLIRLFLEKYSLLNIDLPQPCPNLNLTLEQPSVPSPSSDVVNKIKDSSNGKKDYSEFVKLKEKEHEKLVEKFGEDGTKERIEELSDAIGSKGYKYNSHYHTILNWSRRKDKKSTDKYSGMKAFLKGGDNG